ncbi:TPA: hypothetical protein VBM32_002267 [Streptococcus agalactiae]|nr:hypothetical protein [Streptococcus agalactiae]
MEDFKKMIEEGKEQQLRYLMNIAKSIQNYDSHALVIVDGTTDDAKSIVSVNGDGKSFMNMIMGMSEIMLKLVDEIPTPLLEAMAKKNPELIGKILIESNELQHKLLHIEEDDEK